MIQFGPSVSVVYFFLLYLAANLCLVFSVRSPKTLYIGGLFPMTGSSAAYAGEGLLRVSKLAINMVNNRSDVLPDHRLQLVWNDTKCDPGHATNVLYESLYKGPQLQMIMLLGPACSSATRATAQTGRLWNLLQVSYASTAADLSNKEKYPLLYSTVPPDSAQNSARMAFLKHFQWKRIATIRQNEYIFDEVMDMFQESLVNEGFELIAAETFRDDPKSRIETLKRKDARIIVGMFYEDQARKVLCEAFKQGMYGEHYMWLLLDWFDNKQWWLVKDEKIDCTQEQMSQAAEGYFSIESARIVSNNKTTISGMTSERFLQSYDKPTENRTNLFVPFAFDSVWVLALTLNNSINKVRTKLNRSLEDFNYRDSDMAQSFRETLENLEFQGITGTIKFTKSGERTRPACIKQMQAGSSKVVGAYFPDDDKIVFSGADVLWQGGKPPSDGKLIVYEIQYVSTPLFCVIVTLASGGILLALYFLWFNIVRRKHRYIKLSGPTLNNLIILGCVLIYISVYMIAIDGRRVDTDILAGLCMARSYLLSIGYSLAVGAMFSKTWRVYQVFRNAKPKRKVFTDKELTGVVGLLVVIDVLVMSLWIGVDMPKIVTTTLESQVKDEPHLRTIPQQQYCSSKYFTTWLYILLGYKLLLLLIGCFIAWATRKVKVHSLNDSRWVGMSVYNIVLCVIVGMPLSFLIEGHVDALVACSSFFLLLPSTTTLCLLFVPKIIKLKNDVEELLRLQSLSASNRTVVSTASTNSNSSHKTSVNDPFAVTRLQQEIAALKQEIRAIKGKDDEDTGQNLSIRIEQPVENSREERTLPQPESKPLPLSPRPQLGKRSVTCHTAKELGVNTGRKRRRSSSFSGPYLQRQSLDLGSLFSEHADPLLVLKAENRELQRKLQEAKISETGKIVKVLSENAQLHKKIDELNVKNSPSDEAEKISRLVKENAELKRQLGEVSILNSAWCDVTPRLKRKQIEERKISKDLRELQHLLNVDLGGRRPGSFGPSSLSRPPPIGRSQSSSDLQISWNGNNSTEKKPAISPLERGEAKRFSFDSVSKKRRTGIALRVTDTENDREFTPESPKTERTDSGSTSPTTARRDNIDGCESDVGAERVNAGFSDEDEGVEDRFTDEQNSNFSCKYTAEGSRIENSKNEIVEVRTSKDAKEQPQGIVNHALNQKSETPNLPWTTVTVNEPFRSTNDPKVEAPGDNVPNGTSFGQGISKQSGATVTRDMADSSKSGLNDTPRIQKPTNQDEHSSANLAKPVSDPKPLELNIGSTTEAFPSSLIITNFDAVIDKNSNLRRSDKVKNKLAVNSSQVNASSEEAGAIASQDLALDWTLCSERHDEGVEDEDYVANEGSPRDVPAYKKKTSKKKEKAKNGKIEKTFFV